MKRTVTTVITDVNGTPLHFESKIVEWNPPPDYHAHNSKSSIALKNIKVGEILRIVHPELKCNIASYNSKSSGRVCSLQPTIYQLRKKGMVIEYYHEVDHIIVVRRLK